MTDLDTIRKRHVEYRGVAWEGFCAECKRRWRCDTRVVLDVLDETVRSASAELSDRTAKAEHYRRDTAGEV